MINGNEEGEDKYKLVLTKSDKQALFKVLDEIDLSDSDSQRIKENFDFFRGKGIFFAFLSSFISLFLLRK